MGFGCLLHWHWKASIISHLSVEIPKVPFQSLDELIASPYQITLLKDSSYQTEFETAEKGSLKKAWNTKFSDKEHSLQTDPKIMMSYVMAGKFVMYDSYSAIRSLKEFQDCKITDAGFSVSLVYTHQV